MGGSRKGGPVVTWSRTGEGLLLLLRGRTVRTATPVSAVVGTVLSAVNQGEILLGGVAGPATWVRIGVNYLVPFLVASYGFLSARRVTPAAG